MDSPKDHSDQQQAAKMINTLEEILKNVEVAAAGRDLREVLVGSVSDHFRHLYYGLLSLKDADDIRKMTLDDLKRNATIMLRRARKKQGELAPSAESVSKPLKTVSEVPPAGMPEIVMQPELQTPPSAMQKLGNWLKEFFRRRK